jgi:hypothetical protein
MPPPILSKPSKAAHMAILYITFGALLMVWSGVWYAWMLHTGSPDAGQPRSDGYMYFCYAIFFSGLTLLVIGMALGRIGRAARKAELPPETSGAPTAQPAVAAPPVAQPMVPGQPTAVVQPTAAVPPVAATAPVAQVR